MALTEEQAGASQRLRLLHVGMHAFGEFRGGGNRYLAELTRVLGSRPGISCEVLVAHERRLPDMPKIARVGVSVWRLMRLNIRAVRMIRNVDVIDVHFGPYVVVPVLWARFTGRKVVVHFQGPWADEARAAGDASEFRWRLRRQIERVVYSQAHVGIVLSSAFGELLKAYTSRPLIIAIPPGIDYSRFREARPDHDDENYEQQVYICCVRRLVPRMGVDVLIDAWAYMRNSFHNAGGRQWRLTIVGDGPSRCELEERAAAQGVGESVTFRGEISDEELIDVYRGATVSVVPSIALEGFGLVVLESLACGTPVIATSVGGLPDALFALSPQCLCQPNDPVDLGEKLRKALCEPQWLPNSEECKQYSVRFSWDVIARRHVELYNNLLTTRAVKGTRGGEQR